MDGDGIGYRTLPGTEHPAAAYFARGSGHNEKGQYSKRPDDFERNMKRINKKFETARSAVPRPEVVANGKSTPLTEVAKPLDLKPGTWVKDKDGVSVCFDLPKGESAISC